MKFTQSRRWGLTALLASLLPLMALAQVPAPTVVSGTISTVNLAPTGVATPNSAVEIITTGKGVVGLQVTSTWVGTLTAYCTLNSSAWAVNAMTPLTANAITKFDASGCVRVRVAASAWTSGSALVTLASTEIAATGTTSITGGDASAALQTAGNASLASIDGKIPASPSTVAGQTTTNANVGPTNETAAASNVATSGLNGLIRRFLGFFTSTANTDANRLPVSVHVGDPITASTVASGNIVGPIAVGKSAASVIVNITANTTTMAFEASTDGTVAYASVQCWLHNNSGSSGSVTSATTANVWVCPTQGTHFQVRQTAPGGATVTMAPSIRQVQNAISINGVPPQITEDAASSSGTPGYFIAGIRRDALGVNTSADADFGEFSTNKWGAMLSANYQQHAKSYSSTVNVAAAASATDIATICGNATTPAWVSRVRVTGVQTTAGLVDMQLIKRSTADSGGTSGAGVIIPLDSGDGAAASTVLGYTANPTTGTGLGNVRREYVPIGTATSLSGATEWSFGTGNKLVALKTTSECLAVNLNGVTVAGLTANVTFEWIELP